MPAPPKVSIFKSALEASPSVSVSEDSTESQSLIITLPPEAFQQKTTQGVVQKTCSEILTITSTDQTMVLSSSIAVTDTAGGCQISFTPIPNAAGDLQFIASSTANPSDQFNIPITIINTNDAPTDIALSSLSLIENSGANALVASLSATDLDPGDTFTFSLVVGTGDSDNNSFNISATQLSNQLQMTSSADFETKSSYSVRLRATDQGGLWFEKEFTISITNINEAPSVLSVTNQTTNQDTPTTPIAITISDVDGPIVQCNSTYLSYTSQNISVVAATGAVSWSGAWPNCTAVITPVTGATGSSDLTISASDGILTGQSQSFTLQVGSVPVGWYQEAYIKASNANAWDYFGSSASISGDTAIVGVLNEDSNQTTITNGTTASADNSVIDAGASYIYKRTGSTWAQEAYIKASNANASDLFGTSVSISGDTAIVGAYGEASSQTTITNGINSSQDNSAASAGASYIYKRTGSSWAQEAYIKASNADASDRFGASVSVSGDRAIVGAYWEASSQTTITNGTSSSQDHSASNAGASYIYRRSQSLTGYTWVQEAYLKASNANANDLFGRSVSISGDTVIVGADSEASNQTTITNGLGSSSDNTATYAGSSYIYKRTGSLASGYTWVQEAYIKASNANSSDSFGAAVSISGDTAIVGAWGEASSQTTITNGLGSSANNTSNLAGASYIYKRTGSLAIGYSWAQEAYLKASNTNASDYFGSEVSISGDTAIVGAQGEDSPQTTITNGTTSSADNTATQSGASYIYKRTGSLAAGYTWAQEAYLKGSKLYNSNFFGGAVSISGDTAIVGANGDALNQTTITNGTLPSANTISDSVGAVYVYRNLSRIFEAYEISSIVTSSSFTLNWNGTNLGSANGTFKVVYDTTTPGLNCSSGTVAYTGTATSVSVTSGLTPGQSYIVRICVFHGVNYSEGVTTAVTVKGDNIGPTVLSINRGSTPNPVAWGTSLIDYVVTFDEPVVNLTEYNLSLTEVTTTTGATGQFSSISCSGAVCTVWVIPGLPVGSSTSTAELRLDLTNTAFVYDIWGNPLAAAKMGDETFTIPTGWAQEAYIKASNANTGDVFGSSVSLSGDTALVGASNERSNQTVITNGTTSSLDNSTVGAGAVYVYKRTGSLWAQEAYIKASNTDSSDWFGESVSISGDTAIVGVRNESSNQTTITNGTTSSLDNTAATAGASYIYRRTGTGNLATGYTWAQEAYIKASNANAGDSFGWSVAISGNTGIVGARSESSNQTVITNGITSSPDNTAVNAGASYIYKRTGSLWAQEAYLKASNLNQGYFGQSVSISGDTAIVGAYAEASNQTFITNGTTSSADTSALSAGASYVYKRTGSLWAQEAYIKASNANLNDQFGESVSISGDTAIVGGPSESSSQTVITNGTTSSLDNSSPGAGAVYIYKRSGSIWAQEAYVKSSNANVNDHFGWSVGISGDAGIVGATWEDSNQTVITNGTSSSSDNGATASGASYIYKRTGSMWTQEAYLKASNANLNDQFGESVSISGDTAIVGAAYEASNQTTITNGITSSPNNTVASSGAAYIYRSLSRIFDPDLRVSAKTTTSITLSWGSNLGSASQVKIAPAASGNSDPVSCTDPSAIALASGVRTYTYSGLTTGTKYAFRVCGFDGTSVGDGSVIREDTD